MDLNLTWTKIERLKCLVEVLEELGWLKEDNAFGYVNLLQLTSTLAICDI